MRDCCNLIPIFSRAACLSQLPPPTCINVCRQILQRPVVAESGATVHFVDDRLETLKSVAARPALSGIKLYLVGGIDIEQHSK